MKAGCIRNFYYQLPPCRSIPAVAGPLKKVFFIDCRVEQPAFWNSQHFGTASILG